MTQAGRAVDVNGGVASRWREVNAHLSLLIATGHTNPKPIAQNPRIEFALKFHPPSPGIGFEQDLTGNIVN